MKRFLLPILLLACAAAHAQTIVNVRAYDSTYHCSTNDEWAPCFNDAIAAASVSGGAIYIPAGTYAIHSPVNAISGAIVHIYGDGIGVSNIYWSPTAAGSLFTFSTVNPPLNFSHLEKLTISAFNNGNISVAKTAVNLHGVGKFTMRDVNIDLHDNAGDVGIEAHGWEESLIDNVAVQAATPIAITASLDHFTFSNMTLKSDLLTKRLIDVTPGVSLSNITFSGRQTWLGGHDGFYWNCASSCLGGINLHFANIRWENADTSGAAVRGYMFNVSQEGNMVNGLLIESSSGGAAGQQGFYFHNVLNATLLNVDFVSDPPSSGSATRYELNIDDTNDHVMLIGTHFSYNYANVLRKVDLTRYFSGPQLPLQGDTVSSFEYFAKRAADPWKLHQEGTWDMGVYHWSRDVEIDAHSSIDVPSPASVGPFIMTMAAENGTGVSGINIAQFCSWGATKLHIAQVSNPTGGCDIGNVALKLSLERTTVGSYEVLRFHNNTDYKIRFVLRIN